MKTNKQNKRQKDSSESQNRTEQVLSESKTAETQTAAEAKPETAPASEAIQTPGLKLQTSGVRPYVNFSERDFNRKLSVEKVLGKLQRWMPKQYELAEVVGKWIWITFPEPPAEAVRADLSQLGFHWNNTRKCWQHPCGETLPRGQDEPKQKYSVWFPSLSRPSAGQTDATSRRSAAKADASPYEYDGPARTAEQVAT